MKGSLQRQDVLEALARQVTPGIKLTALADELGIRKHEVAGLRALLLQLVEEGRLLVLPGGAFAFTAMGRGADPHGKPPTMRKPTFLERQRQGGDVAEEEASSVRPAGRGRPGRDSRPAAAAPGAARAARASAPPAEGREAKEAREPGRKAVPLRATGRTAVKLAPRAGAGAASGAAPRAGAALKPRAVAAAAATLPLPWSAPDMTPEPKESASSAPAAASSPTAAAPRDGRGLMDSARAHRGERSAREAQAQAAPSPARSDRSGSDRHDRSDRNAGRPARPPFGERASGTASGTTSGSASGSSGGRDRNAPSGGMTSAPAATPIAGADVSRPAAPRRGGDGVIGRITIHPAGYGFVATDDGQTVFVPAKYRGMSLDGDQVSLSTWTGVKGIEGRVDEVLARGRARLTGILRRAGSLRMYLEPDDPRIATDYGRVALDGVDLGKEGQAVVVEITQYPTTLEPSIAGRVLKVLGDPEDPRTEIEKILAVASIPNEFPEAALAQAAATPQQLGPTDLADRIDLRSRRFCTIDPETARDFDDALCVEDGPHGGPRVWVAVADVAHYVRWDDALDREAVIRGVSVYLPDRVISMLPIQLSAGICSLNPDVDRCAMVVRLDFDRDGAVVEAGLAAAVIRSHARLDYPGVAAALGGDFRGRREEYRPWEAELHRLANLSVQLRARRRLRGALEIEVGEPKVILDADDPRLVRDVVRAKGDAAVKGAYSLVEEFMIAANEAVGRYFRQRGVPSVWRVHAPPVLDRRETLSKLLGAYGIAVDIDEVATPLGMKKVLDEVAAHPAARALSFLVLRTLTQAVWDTVPIGHFGLASGDYLHFTSPIRRYPDLLVHRLLKHYLHREGQASGGGYHNPPPTPEGLAGLAAASSLHERRAMEAEREAVSMYRSYLMREQVGQRYQGVVSAVTSFGSFVEIDEPFVEGLIRIDSFNEPFSFDDVHLRLTGQLTGTVIALGDTVTVEVMNVSVLRRRIDLGLIATSAGAVRVLPPGSRPARPAHGAKGRGRRGGDEQPSAQWPASKVGLSAQRRAGKEVAKAVAGAKGGGKGRGPLRLGVSHHRSRPGEEEAAGRGGGDRRHSGGSGGGGGGGKGKPPKGRAGKPAGKSAKAGKRKRRR